MRFGTLAAAALAIVATAFGAGAQEFPVRPITMVVPFAAGGPTDVVARIAADSMSRTLGQQVVIENATGAGGTTGSARAMRANPDGYTIVMGHMGTHAASVALYPKLAYDPVKDFEPVGLVAGISVLILAKKDFPAKDLAEFTTYLKANSEKLNMAHAGVGSVSHVTCLLLNSLIGAKPTAVPFNGTGPAMNALVGGQVDYMCDQIVNVVPQINGGTIKGYAIGTPERSPVLADVPTSTEAGLPKFQASAWNALFAPKGTPKPVLDRLTAALNTALDDPAARKRLLDLGADIPDAPGRGQAALTTFVTSEIAKWTPIIKDAGATVN